MAAYDIESRRPKAKGWCLLPFALALTQDPSTIVVKSPIVLVVGCASATAVPQIWQLSRATAAVQSATMAITAAEKQELTRRSLGGETYHLIGVADFVDEATARRIGDRGKVFSAGRVNATGMLVTGSKVAVKGLYIDAKPPRINLTSVVNLGMCS